MQRDNAALIDIANGAKAAMSYVAEMSHEAFAADRKTQRAAVCEIIMLGEAAKRLSTEFRSTHSQIPWKDIAGMRDRLIHGYDRIDLDEVWLVLTRDLPDLLRQLSPILPRQEDE